jgi:hypothetical protein
MATDIYLPLSSVKTLVSSKEDLKAVMLKTVDIFSRLTERRLWLKDGSPSTTDGHEITVPFDNSHAYLLVEHHLSHVLFKTDPTLRDAFLAEYTTQLDRMAKAGVEIDPAAVVELLQFIIDFLDDIRVANLWSEIYAGSGARIFKMLRMSFEADDMSDRGFDRGVQFYIACVGFDLEVAQAQEDKFGKYRSIIVDAIAMAKSTDYAGVLLAAKWLLQRMVDEAGKSLHLQKQKQKKEQIPGEADKERAGALNLVTNTVKPTPDRIERQLGSVLPSSYQPSRDVESEARDLVQTPKSEIPERCDAAQEDIQKLIEKALTLIQRDVDRDLKLRGGINAKVVFHRPHASESIDLTLSPDEIAESRRLKALFFRLIGRRKWSLDEAGLELDVDSWIRRKIMDHTDPLFRSSDFSRGFTATILIDRSGSMFHEKTTQARKAGLFLKEALSFPFVRLKVLGFQSLDNGQVDITDFGRGDLLTNSIAAHVDGNTPLHYALQLAGRLTEESDAVKHVFILTDGEPHFYDKSGVPTPKGLLYKAVRKAVTENRTRGIETTALMIGEEKVDSRIVLKSMFPSNNIHFIAENSIGKKLINVVAQNFQRYLRSA